MPFLKCKAETVALAVHFLGSWQSVLSSIINGVCFKSSNLYRTVKLTISPHRKRSGQINSKNQNSLITSIISMKQSGTSQLADCALCTQAKVSCFLINGWVAHLLYSDKLHLSNSCWRMGEGVTGAGKHFILHDLEPATLFLPNNRCQRGNGKFNHSDLFSLFKLVTDLIFLDSFGEQEIVRLWEACWEPEK